MGTSSACLFRDGELIAAIEEERLSRIKNDGAFPLLAIAECLRIAGVAIGQVDAVCVYWKPWRLTTRVVGTARSLGTLIVNWTASPCATSGGSTSTCAVAVDAASASATRVTRSARLRLMGARVS